MSADKVWVRTFKTGYKQVTLKQQPFDPAPCGYDDATEYTRTGMSQAAVTAALEAAAGVCNTMRMARLAEVARESAKPAKDIDVALQMRRRAAAIELNSAHGAIRALITPAQHDALAAHVAAEVAKARAEDAAKISTQVLQRDCEFNNGWNAAIKRVLTQIGCV